MLNDDQIQELFDLLLTLDQNTKIYLGCDSVRYRKRFKEDDKWVSKKMARYATVLIVHKNGKNGAKIFSNVSHEPDYDLKAGKPKMRMMNEVMKVCELYNQVGPLIDEFDIEIHLDISTDPKQGSNVAANEAAGYVLGMTGIEPKLKPESFASSFGADWFANGKHEKV
jgi:predicted RNase H-related nuclease YkuK (DUF458 family)